MSKLIYSKALGDSTTGLLKAYPNIQSATNNPQFYSIAFTDDGYLVTHGKTFKLTLDGDTNVGLTAFTRSALSVSITVSGTSKSIALPGITGDTILSVTAPTGTGNFSITHKGYTAYNATGSVSTATPSVTVPIITVDAYGHVSALTSSAINVDYVKKATSSTNRDYPIFFGDSTAANGVLYNTGFNYNPNTTILTVPKITLGSSDLQSLLNAKAPNSHAVNASTYGLGTASVYGHLKLSDAIDSTSAASGGIAATPYAVSNALSTAKTYASGLFASNDAMVFKGTIGTTTDSGTVQALPTTGYSAGWTYRVVTAATYAGQVCEIGDMIVAVKDYATATANTDWTVIQTNIDGAVTTSTSTGFTTDTVLLGAGTHSAKSLANGSDGQVLKLASGVPTWSTDYKRAITVDGASFLAEDTTTAFNIKTGTNISFTKDSSGNLTINSSYTNTTYTVAAPITLTGTQIGVSRATSSALGVVKGGTTSGQTYGVSIDSNGAMTVAVPWTDNNTTYNQATSDTLGLIKVFSTLATAPANSITATTGKYYGISLDSAGKALVNVPWTDTHYTALLRAGASTGAANAATSNPYIKTVENGSASGYIQLKGGDNVSITSDANGIITIVSTDTNTWRDVKAWKLSEMAGSTDVIDTVLANGIGTIALAFSSTFAYDDTNNQMDLVWAEVESDGTITYTV